MYMHSTIINVIKVHFRSLMFMPEQAAAAAAVVVVVAVGMMQGLISHSR
jgi:hypothetical protein